VTFDKIAVVDFGGQYAHLIATKIRQLNVLAEIVDPQAPLDEFRAYKGIILSGSPYYSSADEGSDYTKAIFELDVPILGFCFGHQEVAKAYGGQVAHTQREYGLADLNVIGTSRLLANLEPRERVWMSHGDTLTQLPDGFVELATSTLTTGGEVHHFAAIGCDERKRYGFQFHPEVDDTTHGQTMLHNFVVDICGCQPNWTMKRFIDEVIDQVREDVGDRRVLLLASGGVDSTVTAKLLAMAIGTDKLYLIHIDNGLMRKNESRQVVEELRALGLGASLHFVDATDDFLTALDGEVEPERKRHIIGSTFIEVTNREASRLDLEGFVLGQGTIYPDHIETGGSKHADVIKTHHNRVPIVEQMIREGRVVEPLKELYKAEVRATGRELGLREPSLERHPFPGPGLGIRALCTSGPAPTEHDDADARLAEVLAGSGLTGRVLPIRSVGVKGDERAYEWPALLAGPDPGHHELLDYAARIYKSVPGINRCVFDLNQRPITTVEVAAATLTPERLDLLREVDAWVMDGIRRHGLLGTIWQCPTVFLPLVVDGRGREFVIVRPVLSERGMTASPAEFPKTLRDELVTYVASLDDLSGVGLDLTTKPPGTIEWE